jgi:hypothetical protein
MTVLSFAAMYFFMYSMVDTFANVYPSLTKFYMTILMTAPMIIFELLIMGAMYSNKKFNMAIIGFSIGMIVIFWIFIRQQVGVTDKQFLQSMIPHHSAAILMCKAGHLQDPQIQDLCKRIAEGQQKEINEMKAKLEEMNR